MKQTEEKKNQTGKKVIVIGSARGTSAEIAGTEYYFLYDGEAIFQIQSVFGPCVLPDMSIMDEGGVNNILAVSEILTERAVQKCKKYGITDVPVFKRDILNEIDWMPYMLLALQKACGDAADIGFARELNDEDEEIDLVLLKHQKKTGITGQSTSRTD